jgi:ferrous-iron efflux pump FieF
VRVRHSGPHLFIDVHVLLDGDLKLDDVHNITDKIEEAVNQFMPTTDIVVHPEPAPITPVEG